MALAAPPRRRLLTPGLLLFLGLLLGLGALLWTLVTLGPWSDPEPPAPPHTPRPLPYTEVHPLGANVFLDRVPEAWKVERVMEMMAQAGIHWVKQEFPWAEIEPRPGYFWDDVYRKSSWEKFDRIVDAAEAQGLEVIARLDRPPEWARLPGTNPEAPPRDFEEYARFVADFVRHYRGRVRFIQIWNEPNLNREWVRDQPVDPKAYAELLCLAAEAARAVDPNVVILAAPLAMTTENDPERKNLDERIFLQEMYEAGARDCFDILGANAYGFDDPPDAPPAPDRLNFRRVELLRQVMEANGDGGKAVWLNEYGWNAVPDSVPPEQRFWGQVDEETQARWTVEGIEYALERWPWIGVISLWYFWQGGEIPPSSAEYYFRLVDPDFTPRRVYYAVSDWAQTLALAGPGSYEEASPPLQRRGPWLGVRDPSRANGEYLRGEPEARLSLTYWGHRVRAWLRAEPGTRVRLILDDRRATVIRWPDGTGGWTVLELAGDPWEAERPARTHTLWLQVEEGVLELDRLEVLEARRYRLFAGLLLAELLWIGGCAWGLGRRL